MPRGRDGFTQKSEGWISWTGGGDWRRPSRLRTLSAKALQWAFRDTMASVAKMDSGDECSLKDLKR